MNSKNQNKVIFIAEAGINHNGSLKKAIKMIDVAADAKADFIKFQHTNPDLISSSSILNLKNNKKINQKKLTNSFHLDWNKAYPILLRRAKKKKIKFLTSVFSVKDYQIVKKYNLKYIKIASGEIINYPLLDAVSKSKDNVILSTGCSTIEEIKSAIKILRQKFKNKKIFLLQCVSSYPVPNNEINLNSINFLRQSFCCEIGYSDHGIGDQYIYTAIGMGAKIIEKHFTLEKKLSGPDHKISLNPKELKKIIKNIRNIEFAIGTNNKIIQNSEKKNLKSIRQSIHASKFIKKGEFLTSNNICLMRPAIGLNPMLYPKILNKVFAEKVYQKEDPIMINDFNKKKNYKFLK